MANSGNQPVGILPDCECDMSASPEYIPNSPYYDSYMQDDCIINRNKNKNDHVIMPSPQYIPSYGEDDEAEPDEQQEEVEGEETKRIAAAKKALLARKNASEKKAALAAKRAENLRKLHAAGKTKKN